MDDIALYAGREATWVKHEVLRQYLQRLAYKVGGLYAVLNYVDGFAGPWRAQSENLSDTSPHIAIHELLAARAGLENAGRSVPDVRCLFIEKDDAAIRRLKDSVQGMQGVSVLVFHGEFETHIPDVLSFANVRSKGFTFFFIDPTGWTGFGLRAIAPVLRHTPGEVLINFMTKDIKRFIDDPESVALPSFKELFGVADYRSRWKGLNGQDREDVIVQTYCECIKEVGNFKYVVSAVVLHPKDERTHFHLIYGTRNIIGLRTFRDVESNTMQRQERLRAQTQQKWRITRTSQHELFSSEAMGSGGHYDWLRERYLARSRERVLEVLRSRKRVTFDDLEEVALTMPMTWNSDLQKWLAEWRNSGKIRVEGLAPKERTLKPKPMHNHIVVWTSV